MSKRKKSQGTQKAKMTAHEFVAKLIDDKEFRRQVLVYCYGFEPERGNPDAIPKWLNAGARLMGHKFFERDVIEEFNTQMSAAGVIKRTRVMGTLMGAASAAKKVHDS